jgi:hypothetical protein
MRRKKLRNIATLQTQQSQINEDLNELEVTQRHLKKSMTGRGRNRAIFARHLLNYIRFPYITLIVWWSSK